MKSEREFDHIKPEHLDVAMQVTMDLYKVPRSGWIIRGIHPDAAETDGQHTDAMIKIFEEEIGRIDPKERLDRKKMLRMIQIHDWAETKPEVGDQITVNEDREVEVKLKKQKRKDEIQAMDIICAKLGNEGEVIRGLWDEFEANETPEAKIVKQIDKLQAIEKAWEYEQMPGNSVSAWEFIKGVEDRGQITNEFLLKRMNEIKAKCKR